MTVLVPAVSSRFSAGCYCSSQYDVSCMCTAHKHCSYLLSLRAVCATLPAASGVNPRVNFARSKAWFVLVGGRTGVVGYVAGCNDLGVLFLYIL